MGSTTVDGRGRRPRAGRLGGRIGGRRGRSGGRPAAGHGQNQVADVPRPVQRTHALSGAHVPRGRRARPVRRRVARRVGRRGRELGAVRVLRPVPADGGRVHRGSRSQADGRAQQRGGRLHGVVFLIRCPMPH